MIGASDELSPYVLEFLVQTPIFKKFALLVYMRYWSTCRPVATRFLAVYWLKKSFLSKVKGMNDRGIRRTFPLYARFLPKYEI